MKKEQVLSQMETLKRKAKEIMDMEIVMKDKTEKYNKELGDWVKECGMPDRFQLIDVIDHFWQMRDKWDGK